MSKGHFTFKNMPSSAGAYMITSVNHPGSFTGSMPIFTSISDYANFGMRNRDKYYYVMPNYKLIVYSSKDFTPQTNILNNYGKTTIASYQLSTYLDTGESCKLYFDNDDNEIISTTDNWNTAV